MIASRKKSVAWSPISKRCEETGCDCIPAGCQSLIPTSTASIYPFSSVVVKGCVKIIPPVLTQLSSEAIEYKETDSTFLQAVIREYGAWNLAVSVYFCYRFLRPRSARVQSSRWRSEFAEEFDGGRSFDPSESILPVTGNVGVTPRIDQPTSPSIPAESAIPSGYVAFQKPSPLGTDEGSLPSALPSSSSLPEPTKPQPPQAAKSMIQPAGQL